jgi:hypothetical protein
MYSRADDFSRPGETARRLGPPKIAMDCYRGIELGPTTLESLVTWDVSGHARREQDRLSSAYRILAGHGGY